jgi:enamine deaminase RidA (YjgF/YER057c/UK114 family)
VSPVETIPTRGCRVVLRRVHGPNAEELFFHCRPLVETATAAKQAETIYRAILDVLEAEGGSFDAVVSETVFLKNPEEDLAAVREARRDVLAEGRRSRSEGAPDLLPDRPATLEIGQPPLPAPTGEIAHLEVSIQAILPKDPPLEVETFSATVACSCGECARAEGRKIRMGSEARLYVGGLCGAGANAYEQTLAMFAAAEGLLQQAGMEFRDVMRTWIHLREMERDYAELNRARREFFAARGIDPVPASTGIGGGPMSPEHDLCLGIYAVKAGRSLGRSVMTSPTLNEAGTYGADFVRGMRVEEENKVALHVSGTASIDEEGRTAHIGDFDAQVDRMLLNVAALLEGQGATFRDVVSGVTYLKNPAEADRLREKFREAGFEGLPNALVHVPVCRPELLCETEVLAVLPRTAAAAKGTGRG